MLNKVILMGRLTKDAEIRYSQGPEPKAIVNYNLAVKRKYTKDKEPDTDFVPCVGFGKTAEFAEKHLKKGMLIIVNGRLQIRTWENQQGQKHWTTEIVIEDQIFAESKKAEEERNNPAQAYQQQNNYQQGQPQQPYNAPPNYGQPQQFYTQGQMPQFYNAPPAPPQGQMPPIYNNAPSVPPQGQMPQYNAMPPVQQQGFDPFATDMSFNIQKSA